MKTAPFTAVVVCLNILACYPTRAQDSNKENGTINFVNVPEYKVLDVYRGLTKLDLFTATDVRHKDVGQERKQNTLDEKQHKLASRLCGTVLFAIALFCAMPLQAANPAPSGPDFPLFMYGAGNPSVATNFVPYGWNILQDYSANSTNTINTFLQACASINENGPAMVPYGSTDLAGYEYEMTQSQADTRERLVVDHPMAPRT